MRSCWLRGALKKTCGCVVRTVLFSCTAYHITTNLAAERTMSKTEHRCWGRVSMSQELERRSSSGIGQRSKGRRPAAWCLRGCPRARMAARRVDEERCARPGLRGWLKRWAMDDGDGGTSSFGELMSLSRSRSVASAKVCTADCVSFSHRSRPAQLSDLPCVRSATDRRGTKMPAADRGLHQWPVDGDWRTDGKRRG